MIGMVEHLWGYFSSIDTSYVVLWLLTGAWVWIASLGFRDAWREFKATRFNYQFIKEFGNGRALVAKRRYGIAVWFLQAFSVALAIGFATVYVNITGPSVIYSTVTRLAFIWMFFCFWRAKAGNRLLRQEREAEEERQDGERFIARKELMEMKKTGDDTYSTVQDTNQMLREDREQASVDRDEEKRDHKEGRAHRGLDEDDVRHEKEETR
jgi:hypothetical protein